MGNSPIHNRKSIRLQAYDYSAPGAYFVTLVTHRRKNIFGRVENEQMVLSRFGEIVVKAWEWLPQHYSYIDLHAYIAMPNHFHGILQILDITDYGRGGSRPAPTIKPLGELIGAFKTISAKEINQLRSTPGQPVWQRNYYEHIIRDQPDLESVTGYILTNPASWPMDTENPQYIKRNP